MECPKNAILNLRRTGYSALLAAALRTARRLAGGSLGFSLGLTLGLGGLALWALSAEKGHCFWIFLAKNNLAEFGGRKAPQPPPPKKNAILTYGSHS